MRPFLVFALLGPACGGTGAQSGDSDEGAAADSSSTGPAIDPGPRTLVDLAAFTLVSAADDPWSAERPADAACPAGFGLEANLFEVSTDLCTWGTFAQPTLDVIEAGDTLEIILLHDALYAPDMEGAVAHIAVGLDGGPVWEVEIPIPAQANIVRQTWTAERSLPAGTPIALHVHNHGVNNYRLVEITAARNPV
jgi:hypothetical protein